IAEALGELLSEVHLERRRRRLISHVEIGADLKAERLADIEVHRFEIVRIRHRAFYIEHGKIERDRIHVLAAADRHVGAARPAAARAEDECQATGKQSSAHERVDRSRHASSSRLVRHSVTPASIPAASCRFEGRSYDARSATVFAFLLWPSTVHRRQIPSSTRHIPRSVKQVTEWPRRTLIMWAAVS